MTPQLDVSSVLLDPMFATSFDVVRRAETVGANGRTALAPTSYPGQVGVVTPADPDKLERGADGQQQTRAINIRTRFALRDASSGTAPDLVTYDGSQYEVKMVKPWRYGRGWYTALATSIVTQDPANT